MQKEWRREKYNEEIDEGNEKQAKKKLYGITTTEGLKRILQQKRT